MPTRTPCKGHPPNLYDEPPYSAIRQGDLKLIYWHANRKIELFNLSQDIGEKNNLTEQQPEDVSRLAKRLSEHLRETKALMPLDKKTRQPVPLPDQVLSKKLQPTTVTTALS